jgi:metallo-beta-lactamase class B
MKFAAVAIATLASLSSCAVGQTAPSIGNPEWTQPFPPFRIIGNVYWVGTYDLSTYLITTPRGHILINTGLAQTNPLIKAGVEKLGFKMTDIKILTATHGHYDHAAGMAELKRMTGATLVISAPDVELFETGGKADFRFGDTPSARFEPVKVDRALKSGDTIELGGVVLTSHLHAGHTKGATSFTFDVAENGKTYRVGIMNMPSINPGVRVTGMPKFPDIEAAYTRTFQDLKAARIDVFLASHAAQFNLHNKYQPGDPYKTERFVDPDGFQAGVASLEQIYRKQLANERQAK